MIIGIPWNSNLSRYLRCNSNTYQNNLPAAVSDSHGFPTVYCPSTVEKRINWHEHDRYTSQIIPTFSTFGVSENWVHCWDKAAHPCIVRFLVTIHGVQVLCRGIPGMTLDPKSDHEFKTQLFHVWPRKSWNVRFTMIYCLTLYNCSMISPFPGTSKLFLVL